MPDCSARTRESYLLESQEPRESIGPAFHSKNVFHVEHRRGAKFLLAILSWGIFFRDKNVPRGTFSHEWRP